MAITMVMDHPLVQHKVSILRDVATGTKQFKELVNELEKRVRRIKQCI